MARCCPPLAGCCADEGARSPPPTRLTWSPLLLSSRAVTSQEDSVVPSLLPLLLLARAAERCKERRARRAHSHACWGGILGLFCRTGRLAHPTSWKKGRGRREDTGGWESPGGRMKLPPPDVLTRPALSLWPEAAVSLRALRRGLPVTQALELEMLAGAACMPPHARRGVGTLASPLD